MLGPQKTHGFLILEKPIVTPTNPIVKALRGCGFFASQKNPRILDPRKPIVTPTNPIVKARGFFHRSESGFLRRKLDRNIIFSLILMTR